MHPDGWFVVQFYDQRQAQYNEAQSEYDEHRWTIAGIAKLIVELAGSAAILHRDTRKQSALAASRATALDAG